MVVLSCHAFRYLVNKRRMNSKNDENIQNLKKIKKKTLFFLVSYIEAYQPFCVKNFCRGTCSSLSLFQWKIEAGHPGCFVPRYIL